MARITVEDCMAKIDNQYDLVLLAKERTAQLNAGTQMLVPENNDKKTIISLREIGEGKILVEDLEKSAILVIGWGELALFYFIVIGWGELALFYFIVIGWGELALFYFIVIGWGELALFYFIVIGWGELALFYSSCLGGSWHCL